MIDNVENKKLKTIAILICYFGKLPWYFEYFVHSCKYNLTIDIIFITDCEYSKPLPPNFRWLRKSMLEVEQLASDKLGFQVSIKHGYKLCDFKPAYGFLFSDLVEGYDFWAQSDIDIIYGNIRGFITDSVLEEYDFISIRHDYTTGCFALYRNNSFMNTIFMRSKDYKLVFSNPTHFCFDECNFRHDLLTEGKSIFDIETDIESFTHPIKRAELNGEIKAHFDFILLEGVPGKIKFNQGIITYRHRLEGVLYHLFWLKRIYNPKYIPATIPETYYVSPTRIYFKQ